MGWKTGTGETLEPPMYRSVIMLPQIVWIQFLQLCHNFWR